jgi:hypothetical protein
MKREHVERRYATAIGSGPYESWSQENRIVGPGNMSADSIYGSSTHLIWGTTSLIYWSAPMKSDQVRWERIMTRIH